MGKGWIIIKIVGVKLL